MKILSVLFLILIDSSYCHAQNESIPIRCIQLTNIFPKIELNGTTDLNRSDTDVIKIYYYEKRRIYELTSKNFFFTKDKSPGFTKEPLFFIFHVDSSYALEYDVVKKQKRRIQTDSLLQTLWITRNKIYPILTTNIAVLTSTHHSKKNLEEHYLIKDKITKKPIGDCIFNYSANLLPFKEVSLSRELDSLHQMKLSGASITSYRRFFPEKKVTMPRFQLKISLAEIPVTKAANIFALFALLD